MKKPTHPPPSPTNKPPAFKHPACTFSEKQLQNFASEHSKKAIKQLESRCPLAYAPRPLEVVDIGPYGAGTGHDEFIQDATQCLQQTILYIAKREKARADKSIEIILAWATKCRVFRGSNAPLECAWGGTAFVRAAELLKYTYPAWNKSPAPQALDRFLDTIVLPNLTSRYQEIWRWKNNWILTIQEALLQIALYRDNRTEFDKYIADFRAMLPQCVQDNGHCTETMRDLCHTQFQIGSMIQIAEMAWHQGIDLYSPRILACMEYHASILNGVVPPGVKKEELKDVWYMPCAWNVGHNHYAGRKAVPMPHTTKLLTVKAWPEHLTFNWGPGWLHKNTL